MSEIKMELRRIECLVNKVYYQNYIGKLVSLLTN